MVCSVLNTCSASMNLLYVTKWLHVKYQFSNIDTEKGICPVKNRLIPNLTKWEQAAKG
jgi:hypothetical protein